MTSRPHRRRRPRTSPLAVENLEPRAVLAAASPLAAVIPPAASGTTADVRAAAAPTAQANGTWTILVYMTGSNLNQYAFQDINEMESALTSLPSSVKFVTAWDQWSLGPASGVPTYPTGGGTQPAWGTYGRSVLTADVNTNAIKSTFDLSLGEQNTGSGTTLENFIKWGVAQAPADHYILQIWDHGGGLKGSNVDDETGREDTLEISEVVDVLGKSGIPAFEIFSYDNCLMGMAEIGFSLATKFSGYYVASEDNISGNGQDYRQAYRTLQTNPGTVTAAEVAAGMVSAFGTQYSASYWGNDTFSAVRTDGYPKLAAALRAFAAASDPLDKAALSAILSVRNSIDGYSRRSWLGCAYRDLGTFMTQLAAQSKLPADFRTAAQNVVTELGTLVTNKTSDYWRSSGVSIYLPQDSYEYPGSSFTLATYRQKFADFCRETEWDRVLDWFSTGVHVPSTNPTPTPGTPSGTPSLAVGSVLLTEGNAGTTTANVIVTLSAATTTEVTFAWQTVAGTAVAGSDFVAASGTGRIPAGSTTVAIPVQIVGDLVPESLETFTVRISNPVNATVGTASGTVTVADNDVGAAGPTATIGAVSVSEGNFGTSVMRFTITLSAAPTRQASVFYATADGTAKAGEDYFVASGSVIFQPGQTSKTFDVRIVGDTRIESDETLTVKLSKPMGLTLGLATVTGTIVNDEAAKGASISRFGGGTAAALPAAAGGADRSGLLPAAPSASAFVALGSASGPSVGVPASRPAGFGRSAVLGEFRLVPAASGPTVNVAQSARVVVASPSTRGPVGSRGPATAGVSVSPTDEIVSGLAGRTIRVPAA